MSYQSIQFLFFCAVIIVFYYIAGKINGRLQKYIIFAANILFYAFSGVKYLAYILLILIISFSVGRILGMQNVRVDSYRTVLNNKADKKYIDKAKKQGKRYLVVALILMIGVLFVCKYLNFIIANINPVIRLFHLPEIGLFKLIMPLGISFYTFMAVGYVLDVYWKRIPYEKNFIQYGAFLMYFPHIVEGPIERYAHFKEQYDGVKRIPFDTVNLAHGAELLIWGFFKKLVIAERISPFVASIYDKANDNTGLVIIFATFLYAIQIYADFSGCIDIAGGVSKMLGIELTENFRQPYFSRTIPEFWRRWHISLGNWFKDFIYFPVSTSRLVKNVRRNLKKKGYKKMAKIISACIPTIVVWLITGLWHGASWHFVFWGLYYAVLMVLGIILEDTFAGVNKKLHINTENRLWKLWQIIRTFCLCALGRIFFRAPSLKVSFDIFKKIFRGFQPGLVFTEKLFTFGIDKANFIVLGCAVLVLFIVDLLREHFRIRESLDKVFIVFRWLLIITCLFSVFIFGVYGPNFDASSFIYEQF